MGYVLRQKLMKRRIQEGRTHEPSISKIYTKYFTQNYIVLIAAMGAAYYHAYAQAVDILPVRYKALVHA
jgi:hypothetical protein